MSEQPRTETRICFCHDATHLIYVHEAEATAAVPLDDLIEKARDWRYSDEWIGATFRGRLASTDETFRRDIEVGLDQAARGETRPWSEIRPRLASADEEETPIVVHEGPARVVQP